MRPWRRACSKADMGADFRFETERLVLRDWHEQDWGPFWQHTNTPAVMRWLGGVANADARAAAQARLESYKRDHGHTFWVIERKSDGELLGFCGLKRSNQAGGPVGLMEVGWRLREDAWGMGHAREAASASLDLAFDRFGADEVVAFTVEGNTASWGLMLRLGMTRRADLDYVDDRYSAELNPTIGYAITKDQWEQHSK
jgi:RimJ/RimL family protein N-acetyltransferase